MPASDHYLVQRPRDFFLVTDVAQLPYPRAADHPGAFLLDVSNDRIAYAYYSLAGRWNVVGNFQTDQFGQDGADGEQGEMGPPGERGPQGLQGERGELGLPGEQGDEGEMGPMGPQGPAGATGATGAQGPPGLDFESTDTIEPWITAPIPQHWQLTGLGTDDHPQYVLDSGDTITGLLTFASASAPRIDATFTGPTGAAVRWMSLEMSSGFAAGDVAAGGIYIRTATSFVDTTFAIGIQNNGDSDALYINNTGRASPTATTPTGIGMDVNKNESAGSEWNTSYVGFGIQIRNWSAAGGATGGVLLQLNNAANNASYQIVHRTDASAWRIRPWDDLNPLNVVAVLHDAAGTSQKWTLRKDGTQFSGPISLSSATTPVFSVGQILFSDAEVTDTSATTKVFIGFTPTIANGASVVTAEYRNINFLQTTKSDASGNLTNANGVQNARFDFRHRGTGVITAFKNFYLSAGPDALVNAAPGNITTLDQLYIESVTSRNNPANTVTITTARSLTIASPQLGTGPIAVTNLTGILIQNLGATGVTNAVAIDLAAQSGAATLNFAIRNAGNSVQTGYARFGAVTAPTNVTAGDVSVVRLLVGTDAAFPSNVQTYLNLPASGQMQVDINTVQKLLLASGGLTVGVDGSAPRLTMAAMDGTNEGGEIVMNGAAANIDWTWDNNAGSLRWFESGNVRMLLAPTTHGLRVAGYLRVGSTSAPSITDAGSLTMSGQLVATFSAAQNITAVGATILANAHNVQITADNSYTLTSTPTIANGQDGQLLTIVNADAVDTITLQDETSLAGSNLRTKGGTGVALGPRDTVTFVYNTALGDWIEIARSDN